MKSIKLFLILALLIFSNCFKAERSPWDSSTPEGLVRNLTIQSLKSPVQAIQNQPPVVKSFTSSTKNLYIDTEFQISWEVYDPDGDQIKCELDLEPDGIIDHTDENCGVATFSLLAKKTGLFYPILKVSDPTHPNELPTPLDGEALHFELKGKLDPNFVSQTFNDINDILVLVDGKIAVTTYDGFSSSSVFILSETGSILQNNTNFSNIELTALAQQKDGKILAAGRSGSYPYYYYVARLLPDLSFDPSFGTGGVATPFSSTYVDIQAMQIDENGRIVLAGSKDYSTYAVIRLLSNGTPDSSFYGTGLRTFTADTSQNYLYGLSLLPDGKILVSGAASNSSDGRFVLAKLNPDGNLDTSFGLGGIAKYNFSAAATGRKHTIQKDGKIIVCGNSTDSSPYAYDIFTLVRFHANGSLDTSFGLGGVVTLDVYSNDRAYSVFALEDGKILATGEANDNSNYPLAARFLSDGNLDISFGTGGKYIHSSLRDSKVGTLTRTGKLLLAGKNAHGYIILLQLK